METLTRQLKAFYEEIVNSATAGMQSIDNFLFGTPDIDADSQAFAIDELITQPYGVSFRKPGEQSHVRPYTPGVGNVYEVPRTSEKTVITERLRDAVIVGGEAWESLPSREARIFRQVLRDHTVGHNVTRWKLAIDTIRNGIFAPLGIGGESIGLEIDFGRDASLSMTYDFTATGATMDKALGALYDAYRAQNGSGDELVVIMGEDWLTQFENDTNIQKRVLNNTANILLEQSLVPENLMNVYGLKRVATYRPVGKTDKMYICAFNPQGLFIQTRGTTGVPFMPANEVILFSLGSTRFKVQRGVDILNDSGKAIRAVGDVVFDSYTEKDPVAQVLRSSARYAFVPANKNHTARSVGTFETDSES